MFGKMLENLREKAPLIHSITNPVTVNQCANMLLACGASPIMADDPMEAAQITGISNGLVLNMGTLSQRTIPSMMASGKQAGQLGLPIVLDPVGVAASDFRMKTARMFLEKLPLSVIRGNLSEIRALGEFSRGPAGVDSLVKLSHEPAGVDDLVKPSHEPAGVDALAADRITEENLPEILDFARDFSRRTNTVSVITGAIDLVTDGEQTYCIRNGHPLMRKVTGTGCQLSALTGAFVAANPGHILEAAAAAVTTMGLAGEIAFKRLGPGEGNMTYGNYIIDAVCHLTPEDLEKEGNYEIR